MDPISPDQNTQAFKILLIDDDQNQHNLIRVALQKDFTLISELSGGHALSAAIEHKPDLILLDLQMPHVDGFEVLEQIKRNPSLASIPIFCLSASNDEISRERSNKLGSSSFISKPVNIKTLSQDIQNTLKGLSTSLSSVDNKSNVYVGMNETELKKWFTNLALKSCQAGKKVLTISTKEGPSFLNSELTPLVKDDSIVFLQIKPSFLSRLPFMDDLSKVIEDLKDLLDGPSENYTLIVDRPEMFLLAPSIENKTATILNFGDSMEKNFAEVFYMCKRPSSQFELPAINEMAKILTRHY